MSSRVRPLALLALACGLAAVACGGDVSGDGEGERPLADAVPPAVRAPVVEDGLLIISPAEVRQWQIDGEPFVLIDARDTVQYAREHATGAINVPYVEIRAGARLPTRDQRIVVYCSSETCPISQYAYEALTNLGYGEIYDMRASLQGWKNAGFPTVQEGSATPESR